MLHSVQTTLSRSDFIKSNFSPAILFRPKLWMTLALLIKEEVQYLAIAHSVIQMSKCSTWADIYAYLISLCLIFCCEDFIFFSWHILVWLIMSHLGQFFFFLRDACFLFIPHVQLSPSHLLSPKKYLPFCL